MRMEKVRLRSTEIKQMYFGAFPRNERMPFPMMVAMSKLWNTQFLSFYDGECPCGFVYFAVNRKFIFIMFLAVDKSLRSKGYGSSILQAIQESRIFFALYSNGTMYPKIWQADVQNSLN